MDELFYVEGETVVIVVCRDDPELVVTAKDSAAANRFGSVFKLDDGGPIPALQAKEDLFIIAHGAVTDKNEPGNAMIGDQRDGGYGYNAVDLFARLVALRIFPAGYQGNVYVSACYSADWLTTYKDAGFSFIEAFRTQIESKIFGYKGCVYGHKGAIDGDIPQRDDPSWVRPQL